jgi:hypothetical protein
MDESHWVSLGGIGALSQMAHVVLIVVECTAQRSRAGVMLVSWELVKLRSFFFSVAHEHVRVLIRQPAALDSTPERVLFAGRQRCFWNETSDTVFSTATRLVPLSVYLLLYSPRLGYCTRVV